MSDASSVAPDLTKRVGVMVVDDQPPFRRAARAVINATAGFEALRDAESGLDAVCLADQLRPDLVLVDVHMPEMDGFETSRRLTQSRPECVVVLVSLNALDLPLSAVTDCGAVAFVRKQELRPATLRALWWRHGAPAEPGD
jgi:two-component system invasion response regulator UvrY